MSTVTPRADSVTVTNFGTTTVNISGYRLSSLGISTGIENLTLVSGSLMLGASESVILSGFSLNNAGGDLALFYATGSLNDSGTMVDFVQWGSGGN